MFLRFTITFAIIFAISAAKQIILKSSIVEDNSSASKIECGQYDFRCIDEKSYQICGYTISDDTDRQIKEPSDLTYQCGTNTICDLDNPAFCSPKYPIYMPNIKRNINNNENELENQNINSDKTIEANDETLVAKGAAGIDCTHYGYFPGKIF